jgi:uncharacterized membrane protein YkoI
MKMKTSKILLVSIFITSVILVIIGGVTSNVLANKSASSNQAAPAASQQEIQAYQEREASYNQLIQQANQQLEKANSDLQAMQLQINQMKGQAPADQQVNSASAAVAISTQKAAEKASQAVELGQSPQKEPELVSYEGKTAYEVVFQKGSVYIDAQTGEVLFNGTVPQEISVEKAAQVASDYMKNPNILQVDKIQFRGNQIYRVIFQNGYLVFMDLTGQITYIQAPGPRAAAPQVVADSGASGGSSGSHEYEDHSEHGDD